MAARGGGRPAAQTQPGNPCDLLAQPSPPPLPDATGARAPQHRLLHSAWRCTALPARVAGARPRRAMPPRHVATGPEELGLLGCGGWGWGARLSCSFWVASPSSSTPSPLCGHGRRLASPSPEPAQVYTVVPRWRLVGLQGWTQVRETAPWLALAVLGRGCVVGAAHGACEPPALLSLSLSLSVCLVAYLREEGRTPGPPSPGW